MMVRGRLGNVGGPAILVIAAVFTLAVSAAAQSAGAPAPGDQKKPEGPPLEVFKGVRLGMTVDEARNILGKPTEKDDTQDLFVLSDERRMRVYYGPDHRATAIVSSFIGATNDAPTPESILGQAVKPAADGSASGMVRHTDEGYWISYSRVAGDPPMVLVTIQKL